MITTLNPARASLAPVGSSEWVRQRLEGVRRRSRFDDVADRELLVWVGDVVRRRAARSGISVADRDDAIQDALLAVTSAVLHGAALAHAADPALDARAQAATQLEATDPAAALRAWTEIDHATTDDAAFVAGVNWRDWWFVSPRVGNYQSTQVGPVLSPCWLH